MLAMCLMIGVGIRQYQTQIALYDIIIKQQKEILSSKPDYVKTEYNRLKIGIIEGDVFPVMGTKKFYKCTIADMN
jgi:hypothetical protein